MKYSQIQIKECVVNAIKNYEMVTEAPHASELLPVIVDKNSCDTHSVVLKIRICVCNVYKYTYICICNMYKKPPAKQLSVWLLLFSIMFYFVIS